MMHISVHLFKKDNETFQRYCIKSKKEKNLNHLYRRHLKAESIQTCLFCCLQDGSLLLLQQIPLSFNICRGLGVLGSESHNEVALLRRSSLAMDVREDNNHHLPVSANRTQLCLLTYASTNNFQL